MIFGIVVFVVEIPTLPGHTNKFYSLRIMTPASALPVLGEHSSAKTERPFVVEIPTFSSRLDRSNFLSCHLSFHLP